MWWFEFSWQHLILCLYINVYTVHDKRAHYFSALLPRKCSLINQSTDSVIEKSPTWLNLHSPICCPVECLIEPACRTRLMRSTHTCQARSMNHRKITEDFLDSNLTGAFSIWMYLRPFGATDDRLSPEPSHPGEAVQMTSLGPGWLICHYKTISHHFCHDSSSFNAGTFMLEICSLICHWKNKKWYTGHFYEVGERFREQGAAIELRTDDSRRDVGAHCPWIVSQLCFSGCVYLSPPLSALTDCPRGYNSN